MADQPNLITDPSLELLPQSVSELDKFVEELTASYNLPPGDDTYELIATMIMHMNPNVCRAPRQFFADAVMKCVANKAAYEKLSEFRSKRETAKAEAAKAQQAGSNEKILPN